MGFFFIRENKTTFSHTWCHDISRSIPLDDSNPFIDTSLGSIPLSTLHVDYTSTPLALAGSSHKKGPAGCSWNMPDNTNCDHSQSRVVSFFPQKNLPN